MDELRKRHLRAETVRTLAEQVVGRQYWKQAIKQGQRTVGRSSKQSITIQIIDWKDTPYSAVFVDPFVAPS